MKSFISVYEGKAIPLYKESALASWNASISGTTEDYSKSEKASFDYAKIFTDKNAFSELRMIKESKSMKDPLLIRQLELLYDSYLGGQVDTSLIAEQIRMGRIKDDRPCCSK